MPSQLCRVPCSVGDKLAKSHGTPCGSVVWGRQGRQQRSAEDAITPTQRARVCRAYCSAREQLQSEQNHPVTAGVTLSMCIAWCLRSAGSLAVLAMNVAQGPRSRHASGQPGHASRAQHARQAGAGRCQVHSRCAALEASLQSGPSHGPLQNAAHMPGDHLAAQGCGSDILQSPIRELLVFPGPCSMFSMLASDAPDKLSLCWMPVWGLHVHSCRIPLSFMAGRVDAQTLKMPLCSTQVCQQQRLRGVQAEEPFTLISTRRACQLHSPGAVVRLQHSFSRCAPCTSLNGGHKFPCSSCTSNPSRDAAVSAEAQQSWQAPLVQQQRCDNLLSIAAPICASGKRASTSSAAPAGPAKLA